MQQRLIAVLGANGAGKTTLLRTTIGAIKPTSGRILLDGTDVIGVGPPGRTASGVAAVPEGRQILVSLTVEENLLVGAGSRRDRVGVRAGIEQIYQRFPNLAERRHLDARVLSGGEQQMLAIGRALMARPRLVLLDEPSLGLSPALVTQVYRLLTDLNGQGISMLLVEQNAAMAMTISSRAYVLELGQIVADGTPDELRSSARLEAAYLGHERSGKGDP